MDKWQKCPLIENCQQKSAVCNVQLPDETCYWFRWFRALDNPWHTGTPTEEGWYLVAFNYEFEEGVRYTTDYFKDGKWAFPMVRDISKIRAWQKIEPYKEKKDG